MSEKQLDLVIAGAQKAGTTSLNIYLSSHPNISGHSITEFSFFANGNDYKRGFNYAYQTYFEQKENAKLVAKNVTLGLKEETLPRLKAHNPDVKLVYLLREPVSRAYSAYTMAVKDGWMKRPFSELMDILENKKYDDIMYRHFVVHGYYAKQIRTLLKYFPSKNIRLFMFEDLIANPQQVCSAIFHWMELPPVAIQNQVHNPTFKPRSTRLSGLLNNLRSEDNPIKKMVKSVLPYSSFRALSDQIMNLNRSHSRFEEMDSSVYYFLRDHFVKFNDELKETIDQMDTSCLCSYGNASWLKQ